MMIRRLMILGGLLWLVGAGLIGIVSVIGHLTPTMVIAYSDGQSGAYDIFVMDLNRPRLRMNYASDVNGRFDQPRWSPDGSTILYHHAGTTHYYVVDYRTGDRRPLMDEFNTGRLHDARWSPDGRYVYLRRHAMLDDPPAYVRIDVQDQTVATFPANTDDAGVQMYRAMLAEIYAESPDMEMVRYSWSGDPRLGFDALNIHADSETYVSVHLPQPTFRLTPPAWSSDRRSFILHIFRDADGEHVLYHVDIRDDGDYRIRYIGKGSAPDVRP